jgi:hypothetical protein
MSGRSENAAVPYRVLGRTGERVSAIGIGGWHLALKHVDEELAFRRISWGALTSFPKLSASRKRMAIPLRMLPVRRLTVGLIGGPG